MKIKGKPQIFTGTLVDYPSLRFTPGGLPVCGLEVEEVETGKIRQWECWRDLAEDASEYLMPGDVIMLEGYSKMRSWVDRNGEKHEVTIWTATKIRKAQ